MFHVKQSDPQESPYPLTTTQPKAHDGFPWDKEGDPAGNDEWELVCSLRILAAEVNDADTLDFQVINDDLILEGGQANPRFTVTKTAGAVLLPSVIMPPYIPQY